MIQKPEGFGEIFIKEYLETDDATLPDGSKLIDVFGNPELVFRI